MGNAKCSCASHVRISVHPHVHGERSSSFTEPAISDGSSPRTWGTPSAIQEPALSTRFIPTYMGNAPDVLPLHLVRLVHPHVHGERAEVPGIEPGRGGSSPRTWGTLHAGVADTVPRRFIPTYMGNADLISDAIGVLEVHPHVHGERFCFLDCGVVATGSSPRTWGTPRDKRVSKFLHRFIPTYMGNADGRRPDSSSVPVHPHVHGERSPTGPPVPRFGGSSPRTWGTQPAPRWGVGIRRFIPTYMGNAGSNTFTAHTIPVHPHVHGERNRFLTSSLTASGSSPRTWGTRD